MCQPQYGAARATRSRAASVDDLDREAQALVEKYREAGRVAYVVRSTDESVVRLIGLQLPVRMVCQMLRAAADGYEAAMRLRSVN